jgi:hypothetical protein
VVGIKEESLVSAVADIRHVTCILTLEFIAALFRRPEQFIAIGQVIMMFLDTALYHPQLWMSLYTFDLETVPEGYRRTASDAPG